MPRQLVNVQHRREAWQLNSSVTEQAEREAIRQEAAMADEDVSTDWAGCEEVERIPGKVSGQPILKGTRVIADSIHSNYVYGETTESIAEMYSIPLDQVQKVLDYVLAKIAKGEPVSPPR